MSESRTQFNSRLLNTVSYTGYFSAIVAGGFTFEFLDGGLQASGLGGFGTALAVGAAAAMTLCYGGFIHLLQKGVAPLLPEERVKARPVLIGGTALIMLGSAYPNIIVAGGGLAASIEDRSYIAAVAAAGDSLKAAAQSGEQIETVVAAGAAKIAGLAVLEGNGGLSGSPSSGALADLIAAKSRALTDMQSELSGPRERVSDEIGRIDQSTDKMRSSLIAKDLTPDERRAVMQRHGDEARSAAIAVRSFTPVAALQSLADDLMGPQIEPKWSQKADTRRNQEEGFRKYKDELKRLGKSIARHTDDLQESLKVKVPVYDPPPTSVLVVRHWSALTNTYALALALDGLPLVLYFIACVLYDAARRVTRESIGKEAPTQSQTTDVDLGAHPHATAARARSATAVRRNGRIETDDIQ